MYVSIAKSKSFSGFNLLNRNKFWLSCITHDMTTTTPEDLKKAYKKERDFRVKIKTAAVNMVCMNNESIMYTAELLT